MAKQLTADEESILKRQARRRLIGAVALTTAVVVILPLIFDGELPLNNSNKIELQIPGQNKVNESQASSAVPVVNPSSAVVATPIPIAVPVIATSSVSVVAPVSVAAVSAPIAVTKPEIVKSEVVKPAKAEPAKAEKVDRNKKSEEKPKEEDKPKAEVKSKMEETPKPETKPKLEIKSKAEKKSVALPHAAPHSGYVIQIGAYSNPATAKNMQERLAKQGFHVYTEKVGANVRVRVGNFPTREAAEKVRHKLEALKLHPNLVNLGG